MTGPEIKFAGGGNSGSYRKLDNSHWCYKTGIYR